MSSNLAVLKEAVGHRVRRVTGNAKTPQSKEAEILRREIQAAMANWHYAENHFREATDDDLIDQAAYDLLAAKSRYTYLLKLARREGISL